ncbi:MAG: redoxin domain-containing protein [Chloroflexi bacterium]|nr:redoxin domain-containing protein [Chloroflexota bacterium]MCI0648095.1 redoxin domain-containing protein [Chloroflexota bacterium]
MKWFSRKADQNNDVTTPAGAATALRPGTPAPDFSLPGTTGRTLSLSGFKGQPVVLVFYPADGSPVCSNQLALYNEALPLFAEFDAQLLAISVDDLASHHDFAGQLGLAFPLLADSDPKGRVAQTYGVYDRQSGDSQRALFVIDEGGTVRWSHVSPRQVNPGADGILAALESMKR